MTYTESLFFEKMKKKICDYFIQIKYLDSVLIFFIIYKKKKPRSLVDVICISDIILSSVQSILLFWYLINLSYCLVLVTKYLWMSTSINNQLLYCTGLHMTSTQSECYYSIPQSGSSTTRSDCLSDSLISSSNLSDWCWLSICYF